VLLLIQQFANKTITSLPTGSCQRITMRRP